jgi:hypothetical protein
MDQPAPWNLTGRGFILMYRFPEDFVRDSCFLPEEWKILKWSGLGYVMLVDYYDSPVGPYKELLVIPGKAQLGEKRLRTISKIYVDSVDSMFNGRENWGIPKELTDFTWTTKERRHVIKAGSFSPWFEIRMEVGGIPFPVDSRFLPMHLYQELGNKRFRMSPSGRGTGRFSLVREIKVDPQYFPELNLLEPMIAIYVDPFRMTFPVAQSDNLSGDY